MPKLREAGNEGVVYASALSRPDEYSDRWPDDSALIFPGRNGALWSDSAYRYWRRKVFNPAAVTAGVEHPRPYDLRHSAASLAR